MLDNKNLEAFAIFPRVCVRMKNAQVEISLNSGPYNEMSNLVPLNINNVALSGCVLGITVICSSI